jgi:hypothetical protein
MKWLALKIGGQRWGVFLCSPRSKYLRDDDGRRLDGYCCFDSSRIFLSRGLSESAREDTLLHELLHAMLHVSGGSVAYDRSQTTEEQIVAPLTPVLHRLLRDLGFRFPKGPNS